MEQQQLNTEITAGAGELKSQYLEYKTFTEYPIFDADQHLTEGEDCYTRHIEDKYKDRTLRVVVDGARRCSNSTATPARATATTARCLIPDRSRSC